MRGLFLRLLRQLVVVPIAALASYFLMAALPLAAFEESKRALPSELAVSYRRDLGIGEPLGFLRPWQKLARGERLGTSAQGVTGGELMQKISGSLAVGTLALGLSLAWALGFAALSARVRRGRNASAAQIVPALAYGTPVFIPALALAPYVAEAGHGLPELAAAIAISVSPGVFLGSLLRGAVEVELAKDYVRTAVGKGLSRSAAFRRHVIPNVVPVLLDSLGPVATALLAGSFAAERVFGLPYFGQLYVVAVLQKQVAVVVVATTCFAALLCVVGLLVELSRQVVDPLHRKSG
jgi:oligopeptide transport system permease protein